MNHPYNSVYFHRHTWSQSLGNRNNSVYINQWIDNENMTYLHSGIKNLITKFTGKSGNSYFE